MIYSKAVFQLFGWPAVCGLMNRDRSSAESRQMAWDLIAISSSIPVGSAIATVHDFRSCPQLLRRTGHGVMKRLSSREPLALAASRMVAASLLASYFRSLSLPADTLGTWGTKLALPERRHQTISLTTRHTLLGQLLE